MSQAITEHVLSCIVTSSDAVNSVSNFFFFNDTATTEIYTLSLHDALPISHQWSNRAVHKQDRADASARQNEYPVFPGQLRRRVGRNPNGESSLPPGRSGAGGNQAGQHSPQTDGDVENSQPEDAVKQNQQGNDEGGCPPQRVP